MAAQTAKPAAPSDGRAASSRPATRLGLLAEPDARDADDRRLVRLRADAEHDPAATLGPLWRRDERELEDLIGAVIDLGVRELRLDRRDRGPDADATGLRSPGDRDGGDPARVRERVGHAALERSARRRRACVRTTELTARADRTDLAARAEVGVRVTEMDAVHA